MFNPELASQQIRVASFNLFNFIAPPDAYYDFNNIYTESQWQQKCAWIRHYLAQHQPDVIGFQEVFSIDALQTLVAAAGYPYFAVIDTPEVSEEFIYRAPVVAVASKYPIVECCGCEILADLASLMGVGPGFQFSRQPIRASVSLPNLGVCDCYVVHLKSKRGQFEVELGAETLALDNTESAAHFALEAASKWAAALVRGSEAALLCHAIAIRRAQTQRPVILMGDFNDTLDSGVLSTLVSRDSRLIAEFGEQAYAAYRLQDAYELFQQSQYCPTAVARPATHYHLNRGSVIDYILLSNEFDPHNDQCLAEVSHYHTYDRHLLNPEYARDSHSTDHAPVMVSLAIRK